MQLIIIWELCNCRILCLFILHLFIYILWRIRQYFNTQRSANNSNYYISILMSAQHMPILTLHPSHSTASILTAEKPKKSNVKVICRVKPLSPSQQPIDMKIDKENAQISIPQPRQQTTKTFTFNRIYTNQTQQQFVRKVCDPVLERALVHKQGYLIFSYGVTNSGKTHTILGTQNEPGILPYLVRKLSEKQQVYLSAIELYNDEFFSLNNKEKVIPRQLGGFVDFQQCSIMELINQKNMDEKFRHYVSNRTQNQTKFNSKSSRSHAIFRIKAGQAIIGVVDLAGSQRTNKVFASIDETSNINKSLLCLGRCIKALNENPDTHLPIPYRESKLTKVLIQYFAAKVEVLMIANISQAQNCFHENMNVLDYAVLAKDIRHCSTENSLKKSQFKFKTNKLDVFETLYKSGSKPAYAHKSLKSSRTKMNQKLQKSNIKGPDAGRNFAKALKKQQLQMYIERFDSSQETFDYMIDYMHKKEQQDDRRCIELIKASQYQSPYPVARKENMEDQQKKQQGIEIGVGRSQRSKQLIKKELYDQMKSELRSLIMQERLANMEHKETCIGDSLAKNYTQSKMMLQSSEVQHTPQKFKTNSQQENFIVKTTGAIYSSVKKILSQKVHSLKKIVPYFKKAQPPKSSKLSFNNYGQIYESLFKFQKAKEDQKSRSSQISFCEKLKPVTHKEKQQEPGQEVHAPQLSKQSQKQTQDTCIQTDDEGEYPSLQIYINPSQITVHNTSIIETSPDKQNQEINEVDEEESRRNQSDQFIKPEKQKINPKATKPTKNKTMKNRQKANQAALRVAQMRKYAARLCREQSRTPLKKRLRSYFKE